LAMDTEKIDRTGVDAPRPEPLQGAARPTRRSGRHEDRVEWSAPIDRAEISDEARLLAELRQAVEQAPDVREDVVREVRDALDEGSYRVDPHQIARRILGQTDD